MANNAPIRLFVVDDCAVVRDGFCQLLENRDGFVVVGAASSGEEALKKISDTEVDLALVNISMDGMNGIELTRRLKDGSATLWILIVSMHGETQYVEDALQVGAGGYILKENVHEHLPEAAREVTRGNLCLDQELEARINL